MSDQFALKFAQFLRDRSHVRFRSLCSILQRGEGFGEFLEAVVRLQPCRFARAFSGNNQTVPPAQDAIVGDETATRFKRSVVVILHRMNQRQRGAEFIRAFSQMRQKAVIHRGPGIGPGPVAAGGALRRSEQGLAVPTQRGGDCAFIPFFGADGVDCLLAGSAVPVGFPAGLAVALQGIVFALYADEFGPRC